MANKKLPKGKRLVQRAVGINDEMWDELRRAADQAECAISEVIREAIAAHLAAS